MKKQNKKETIIEDVPMTQHDGLIKATFKLVGSLCVMYVSIMTFIVVLPHITTGIGSVIGVNSLNVAVVDAIVWLVSSIMVGFYFLFWVIKFHLWLVNVIKKSGSDIGFYIKNK